MLQVTMRSLSTILSIYSMIIFVRIILTWIPGLNFGSPGQRIIHFMARITDPYLNFFRRIRFLRIANLDFGPVLGLVLLSIVNTICATIAQLGQIRIGIILGLLISGLLRAVGFFTGIFAIIGIVRLLALSFGKDGTTNPWMTLDHMLQPQAYRLADLFLRERPASYRTVLAIYSASLGIITLVISLVRNLATALLYALPF